MRVTIATDGFLSPAQMPELPYTLDLVPCTDRAGLLASLQHAEAIVTRRTDFDAPLLAQAPQLKLIQQVGVGTDRIDLAAARRHHIAVSNTPGAPSPAVVEHAFLLMLALARDASNQIDAVRAGRWSTDDVWQSIELAASTVGVVGYGSIGRTLAARLTAFGARVIVFTRFPNDAGSGVRCVDLDTLLEQSDFVVLVPALTPKTRGMIGASQLSRMKPSAFLVNISRGAIIDELALCDALISGRLRGAAIDTPREEPLPIGSPLREAPRLLITPHIGGSTRQSKDRIWSQISANLQRLAAGEPLQNRVDQGG